MTRLLSKTFEPSATVALLSRSVDEHLETFTMRRGERWGGGLRAVIYVYLFGPIFDHTTTTATEHLNFYCVSNANVLS